MRYPVSIQDFRYLRETGHHYVDKTEQIARVTYSGKAFFLSRPRRFGKSLLISTLHELHSGDASLFEGLWAAEHWDFAERQRPVLWFKFAKMDYDALGLSAVLSKELAQMAKTHEVAIPGTSYKDDFAALIHGIHERTGQRVVILVDEYDKPIIDYLNAPDRAEENRAVMKQFYRVFEECDPLLEMVFITGITAFSKVSIFSDFSSIINVTLQNDAYDIVGLTEEELNSNFGKELADVDRDRLRCHYNGYSWTGSPPHVYNPWSILSFLSSGKRFHSFWYNTGSPTLLVDELRRQRYTDLAGTVVAERELTAFDFKRIDPVVVMFQTGYLTTVDYNVSRGRYTLDYPNQEVRESFLDNLLTAYVPERRWIRGPNSAYDVIDALASGDIEEAIAVLNRLFAAIPYEHWKVDHEFLFHAVVQLVFTLMGVEVRSEVHTSRGRCDAIVESGDYVYAFEFKRDRPVAEAIAQIEERGYLEAYAGRKGLKRVAVGVSFSTEDRNIGTYETKAFD